MIYTAPLVSFCLFHILFAFRWLEMAQPFDYFMFHEWPEKDLFNLNLTRNDMQTL